jgi:hypothetical protein
LPAIFGILNNTNLFILNCSHAIAEANNPIQGKKAAENSTSKSQTPRNQTVLGSINHPYPARLSWKL